MKEFKDACEKLGISQRFAAKHIMEKTSQGNLSFLLDKGRHKKWNELSPRGRIPYIRMRRWLDSDMEKQQTTSILTQTKGETCYKTINVIHIKNHIKDVSIMQFQYIRLQNK